MLSQTSLEPLTIEDLVHAVCWDQLEVLLTPAAVRIQSLATVADADGCTLLHWAALNNRIAIATFLLERGALVDAVGGKLGETPLHWATRRKYYAMMELLFSRGADITRRNINGCDALMLACTTGPDLSTLYLLLHWGADVNSRDSAGHVCIEVLVKTLLLKPPPGVEQSESQSVALRNSIRLLMKFGASPHLPSQKGGDGALHLFAANAKYDDLALMFDVYQHSKGDNVHAMKNSKGETPYMVATNENRASTRRLLLDALLFNLLPFHVPTATAAATVVLVVFLVFRLGSLTGLLVGAALAILFHRWCIQWSILRHRSRVFMGSTVGWGLSLALLYSSAPLSLFGNIVGLTLVTLAFVLSLRFHRSKPETVHNMKGELLTGILSAPPVEPDIDAGEAAATASVLGDDGRNDCPRICASCLVDRRSASLHCLFCSACVLGQDYHSFFLGNCVAAGNRRVFNAAVLVGMLANLHASVHGYYRGYPLAFTLCCLWSAGACATVLWTTAVLVVRRSTFHLLNRGLMSSAMPSVSVAFARLGSFLRTGTFEVEADGVLLSHHGGGDLLYSREAVWRFVASTFVKVEPVLAEDVEDGSALADKMAELYSKAANRLRSFSGSGSVDEPEYGPFAIPKRRPGRGCESHECRDCTQNSVHPHTESLLPSVSEMDDRA